MKTSALLTLGLAACLWSAAVVPAAAASCGEDVQHLAGRCRLSLAPAEGAPAPGPGSATAEAPATSESRGLAAGPDSLASSGNTLPPQSSQAAPAPQALGAVDRAKVEGLLAEARSADALGDPQRCRQRLQDAEAAIGGAGR